MESKYLKLFKKQRTNQKINYWSSIIRWYRQILITKGPPFQPGMVEGGEVQRGVSGV